MVDVQLDLSKTKAAPGEYRLKAFWDWDSLPVAGDVYLHPYGDLKLAKLAADSRDRLVEGSGPIPLKLEGADFEFVEKAELEPASPRKGSPVKVSFTLPHGKSGGDQESAEAELDTNGLKPGAYQLLLAQSDGVSHPIPVTILPPNPKLDDLPLRPNLDESGQKLCCMAAASTASRSSPPRPAKSNWRPIRTRAPRAKPPLNWIPKLARASSSICACRCRESKRP